MASKISSMISCRRFVDQRLVPKEALTILDPLEIGDGDAAGIGQDIGDHEDLLVGENFVGQHGGRTVGAFAENFAAHAMRVLRG